MPNKITALLVTGVDDLRGGNDNLNLIVHLPNEVDLRFDNVNEGDPWENHSLHIVAKELPDALRVEDILGIRLETTFGGGTAGDNWSLNDFRASAEIAGAHVELYGNSGDPLVRFTGENRTYDFVIPRPTPLVMTAEFVTGSDDLRGGNDNVNMIVVLNNGAEHRFDNINQGQRWADKSTHRVIRNLDGSITPADIAGVRLETTFGGGIAGDNWNLRSLSVVVDTDRAIEVLSDVGVPLGAPLFRFTHEQSFHYFEVAH